jgi:hypothetical protein
MTGKSTKSSAYSNLLRDKENQKNVLLYARWAQKRASMSAKNKRERGDRW